METTPPTPSSGSSASPSRAAGSPTSAGPTADVQATALRVFEEVRRQAQSAGAAGGAADVRDLSPKEMEEIRQLKNPPTVVRRTLEAVFLLLNAAKAPARPQPPTWPRVQKMLSDAGFLSKMLNFDAAILQEAPVLTAYVASNYFCGSGADRAKQILIRGRNAGFFNGEAYASPLKRRNLSRDEVDPLTFERVFRASQATAALFRWSALLLVQALDPGPAQEPEPPPDPPAAPTPEPPTPTRAAPTPDPTPPAPAPTPNLPPARPAPPPARPPPKELPKPKPKPAPTPARPKADEPDRHFEAMATFVFGSATLAEDGEQALQTAAATYCMRRRLMMRLIPCPASIENDALARGRVTVAQDWLVSNGIPPEAIEFGKEMRTAVGEPGVVCQILLHNDTVLRDFYLMVAEGEKKADVGTKDTIRISEWLEESFDCRVH